MHIVLYTDVRGLSTRRLEQTLTSLPFTLTVKPLTTSLLWIGKYTTEATDKALCQAAKADFTFIVTKDNWRSDNDRLRGFYRYYGQGVIFGAVKHRRRWEDTFVHELLHMVKHPIYIELGVRLSDVFGVEDYDRDVVHGAHPDYTEYEYDEVLQTLKLFLLKTREQVNTRELRSTLANFMSRVRALSEQLSATTQPVYDLFHPLGVGEHAVSQAYGVKSSRYSLTGHHIGTDYAVPVGSNVFAPAPGEMVATGYTKTQGYFGHFQYLDNGQLYTVRLLHLSEEPKKGQYARGAIIATTGNTGMSTGPHLHLDVWVGDVDLTSINAKNWSKLTIDPETHYGLYL